MCLNINEKYHKNNKPLIAQEDLFTFKISFDLTLKYTTSYYQFKKQYFNTLLKSKLEIEGYFIEKGLHSIIINKKAFMDLIFNYNFFDSCFSSKCILLCKIPKGSKYFVGEGGDIVSNQLIILEPLVSNSNSLKLEVKTKNKLPLIIDALKKALKIYKTYYPIPKYY